MIDTKIHVDFTYRALRMIEAGADPRAVALQFAGMAEEYFERLVEIEMKTVRPIIVQRISK